MKSTQEAEAFARQWLGMLDRLAPLDEYLKFLPDGDFEQWSYPDAEIKNVAELKAFYTKTWGAIASQTNQITKMTSSPAQSGRYQVDVVADWSASTATGQSFSRTLHYSMTLGGGASSADPGGAFPKVYRYRITRAQ